MNLMIYLPIILNILMIMIMMLPSKLNKFHPISLMMILISLITLISLKFNFQYNSIISYILFLIMVGGLMIMYMYIMSLINNQFFSINLKFMLFNFMKILPILILMILMFYNFKQFLYFNMTSNLEFMNLKFNMLNYSNLNILYKESNNMFTYFFMIYLYYSMICIMNICYKFKAPLRQLMF